MVSNADVKRTFLKLVDKNELPDDFVHSVEKFKIRGSSGKLNIALDSLPEFPALPKGSACIKGDMHFTDSVERMERAYDDWKAGRWSADPFVDMMIPTTMDPTMTSPGKHFMSCFVQYCPPKVEGRDWTDADRDAFAESVISQIADYSPGFRDRIVHMEVRTPRELEAEVGLTEGNIFQGELTFDQTAVQPSGARLCAIPHPDPGALHVRLVHPFRVGGRHGGTRSQRCQAHPVRSGQTCPPHE